MRHPLVLAALTFLAGVTGTLGAEPIVAGHYLPRGRSIGGAPGSALVLVHVYNSDREPIKASDLEIGVEFGAGPKRSFVARVKSPRDVPATGIATFRLPVPAKFDASRTDAWFAGFARTGSGQANSRRYSFGAPTAPAGRGTSRPTQVTSLYSEAPPLPADDPGLVAPPPEIPFEDELTLPPGASRPASRPPRTGSPARPALNAARPGSDTPATGPDSSRPTAPTGADIATTGSTRSPTATAGARPPPVNARASSDTAGSTASTGLVTKPAADPGSSRSAAQTPAPTAAAPATAKVAPTAKAPRFKSIHTIDEELVITVVGDGDSLRSIAENYYGDPGKAKAIAEFNFIDNPESIKVGEEIIVEVKPLKRSEVKSPGAPNATPKAGANARDGRASRPGPAATPAGTNRAPATAAPGTYVVQPGDTFGGVARKLLGSASAAGRLQAANPGLDPRRLQPGTVVVIPATGNQG